MRRDSVEPNDFTYSILLIASPQISPFQIHAQVIKTCHQQIPSVGMALLAAYTKLGNPSEAFSIFREIKNKDIVAWSAMLAYYARAGDSEGAAKLFLEMTRNSINPNEFTLSSTIDACASPTAAAGQGKQFHVTSIKLGYHDTLCVSTTLVTMYARRGSIENAQGVFDRQSVRDQVSWNSMLMGYAQHGYCKKAFKLFQEMEATGRWEERTKMRKRMDARKVKKEAGCSWIQIKNKVHSFLASDKTHPLSNQIYTKLEDITVRLKQKGYRPNTDYVLHDMDEEHKEAVLAQHSERLAIAFGLMATPRGTPLQIVKNLKVCGDCHNVIKLISDIEEREIVVRDSSRFHHFNRGACSYDDYW
ncbi:Pentatricopeptide repeat-containing protein [Canna indica]|uniref:Pentatricopeptide repeat-containing protein n=1 Tax=Canna indica TaxID=4628 RepID=A0AAQ3KKY6_9LILI|nr:Pentatricopeptide repeat-containing protein [Canna indica]